MSPCPCGQLGFQLLLLVRTVRGGRAEGRTRWSLVHGEVILGPRRMLRGFSRRRRHRVFPKFHLTLCV